VNRSVMMLRFVFMFPFVHQNVAPLQSLPEQRNELEQMERPLDAGQSLLLVFIFLKKVVPYFEQNLRR